MTTQPVTGSPGLVDRAKNILLTPRAEWDRIKVEPVQINKLYTGYVAPLAALSALCGAIGMAVFGIGGFGITVRIGLVPALVNGVVQFIMSLVGVYVLALIVDALAPTFGSTKNANQAHKLAAYSATAGVLAGVFTLFPPLAALSILGLYSLVLLYLGLPRLMQTPEDKRVPYFVSIILACIVLGIVIGVAMGIVRSAFGVGIGGSGLNFSQTSAPANEQAEVTLPGGGTVNLNELERFAESMAQGGAALGGVAAAPGAGPAGAAPDPARLQQLLPASLPGGFSRESMSSGAAMGAAQADATYVNGDAQIRLEIVHLGAMGGLGGLAGAMNIQESSQDSDGYSNTRTVNGRVHSESVSRSANSATYGIVGKGVTLTADGTGVSIEQVRAAVDSIGIERVEKSLVQ